MASLETAANHADNSEHLVTSSRNLAGTMTNVTHLECSACNTRYDAGRLYNVCTKCGKPLFVRYDLSNAARTLTQESLPARRPDMWRYREVMPVESDENVVSLGEGWTPLFDAPALGRAAGVENLLIKDESLNPTQSFKARGMSAAVSMALELGVKKLAAPSAGNAGGALAAYAARAGLEAYIFMPRDTPRANIVECQQTGAHVTLIDGVLDRRTNAARFRRASLRKTSWMLGCAADGARGSLTWDIREHLLAKLQLEPSRAGPVKLRFARRSAGLAPLRGADISKDQRHCLIRYAIVPWRCQAD